MSDEVITPEMIELTKKYNITLEDASKFAKAFGSTAAEAAKKAELAFKAASGALTDAFDYISNLSPATIKASNNFNTLTDSLGKLITLTTRFDAFQNLSINGGKAIDTMSDSFTELTTRFGGWSNVTKIFGSQLGALGHMTEEGARKFLENASSAQKLENAYINLQGSTGSLGEVFGADGTIVGNLSAKVNQYGIELANTSAITGESLKTTSDFAAQLGTIPNVMNTMIRSGEGASNTTNALTMAMTLARGSGRSNKEVLDAMSTAYDNLGNAQGQVTDNAQKGAEMFSLMSEASTKLKLRFSDTAGYLTSVADDFKMIGDNTQGATNVLARFSGALQNTGLTAKSSVSVIQTMIKSMSNLEMGTKALISARSGGPGGLQGAFQVENLLREGKVDKVAEMLEKSFKQQAGGKIYTQKEAAESPQAAAQFMRQRMMLQSGAFGGMAKDDASANRLLEAMAAGPAETANTLKNSLDATTSVAEQGTKLQEQQVDILKMLNNSMDRSAIVAQQTFLATARIAIGTGKEDAAKEELITYMDEARQNMKEGFGRAPVITDDQRLEQNKMAMRGASRAGGIVVNRSKELLDEAPAFAARITSELTKNMTEGRQAVKATRTAAQGQRQSLAAETRGNAQPYLSLFNKPNTTTATAVAARQAQTQAPQRLRAPVLSATQQQQQQNTLQPREINLNVKLAEGLEVEVEDNDRGTTEASNAAQGGGVYVKVNRNR
jgi:hypothetical protein